MHSEYIITPNPETKFFRVDRYPWEKLARLGDSLFLTAGRGSSGTLHIAEMARRWAKRAGVKIQTRRRGRVVQIFRLS